MTYAPQLGRGRKRHAATLSCAHTRQADVPLEARAIGEALPHAMPNASPSRIHSIRACRDIRQTIIFIPKLSCFSPCFTLGVSSPLRAANLCFALAVRLIRLANIRGAATFLVLNFGLSTPFLIVTRLRSESLLTPVPSTNPSRLIVTLRRLTIFGFYACHLCPIYASAPSRAVALFVRFPLPLPAIPI